MRALLPLLSLLALAACRTADDVYPDVLEDPTGRVRLPDGSVSDRPDAASADVSTTDIETADASLPDAD